MGTYIHFTDEQKERANSVDLEEFLRQRGEKLLRAGRESRLARVHHITVRATNGTTILPGRAAMRSALSSTTTA